MGWGAVSHEGPTGRHHGDKTHQAMELTAWWGQSHKYVSEDDMTTSQAVSARNGVRGAWV